MTGFTAEWLSLREPADLRARNPQLADALKARFLQRNVITVVDLGSGTGANLRGTAHLLPSRQRWTLIDRDERLLAMARDSLSAWADQASVTADGLILHKAASRIEVGFQVMDLATDLEAALKTAPDGGPDLVTASALFDLASPSFIRRVAVAVAQQRAVFFTVLTYNGLQRWVPRQPIDQQIAAAFHRHQLTDKGFGQAAGPTAPVELMDAFTSCGYSVSEGPSPWALGADDAPLIAELRRGYAQTVRGADGLTERVIEAWVRRVQSGAEVGHTDTLATPGLGAPSDLDFGADDEE